MRRLPMAGSSTSCCGVGMSIALYGQEFSHSRQLTHGDGGMSRCHFRLRHPAQQNPVGAEEAAIRPRHKHPEQQNHRARQKHSVAMTQSINANKGSHRRMKKPAPVATPSTASPR